MLGGDGQAFLEGERQALIGVNKFAGHIRLAIDIARAGVRIDDQIERAFRRHEAVLRQEAGDVTRRHGGEACHAIDGGSCNQRLRRNQFTRGHQQDVRSQIGMLERPDQRSGQRAECGGGNIRHIRVAESHDTVELFLGIY